MTDLTFKATDEKGLSLPNALTTPYGYLEKCIKANIGLEVLGLQLYYPVEDMFEISLQLDRFARLRKRTHITELGISSANRTDPNAFVR